MDNSKAPGMTIRLNPVASAALAQYKAELERQLSMPVTFSQAIIQMINSTKEKK